MVSAQRPCFSISEHRPEYDGITHLELPLRLRVSAVVIILCCNYCRVITDFNNRLRPVIPVLFDPTASRRCHVFAADPVPKLGTAEPA